MARRQTGNMNGEQYLANKSPFKREVQRYEATFCCRLSCRLSPTLSGIAKVELRQITRSVNEIQVSCRTSYSSSVA